MVTKADQARVDSNPSTLLGRLDRSVSTLNPGYFALVMATGIVSVGVDAVGFGAASEVLLVLTAVCYVSLVVLFGWRAVRFRDRMLEDLANPAKGFAYFTFVAGSAVLGTRILADGLVPITIALFTVAGTAWLLLGYIVPWAIVLWRPDRPILAKANGTWFIWTVASQSVAVIAASLQPVVSLDRRELAIIAITSWSVGAALYVAIGVLLTIRLLNYEVSPVEVGQPYWVSMGATAITVLAGARIVDMADAPMVDATRGLVAGVSVLFWGFGTWLWPLLIAAGIWRHVIHKVSLAYEAPIWSMVFPLGMYAVASINLGIADRLPFVEQVGRLEIWLAVVVWAAVFVGMIRNAVRTVLLPPVVARRP